VTRLRRALPRVLAGTADRNVKFNELHGILIALGFHERVRGSHRIYTREGVEEILNLQPRNGGAAKPYQVRQVRGVIVKYRLAGEIE
jgi:hypothetical protein